MANRKKKEEARVREQQKQAEEALKRKRRNRYILFATLGVAVAIIVGIVLAALLSTEDHPYTGGEVVRLEVAIDGASCGEVYIELLPEYAPKTVENFKKLVGEGFYNGLTFHRIIPAFMVQGGDPKGDGTGGSDTEIVGEFSNNGYKNDLKHTVGIVSMARAGNQYNPSAAYNTASSQFFICTETKQHLDGDYAAFGKVVRGMKTVRLLEACGTASGTPTKAAKMTRVTLLTEAETRDLFG